VLPVPPEERIAALFDEIEYEHVDVAAHTTTGVVDVSTTIGLSPEGEV
jgi:hypothetical protein